ncbi:MAG TPA: ABC transporter permease [Isosphaeraceae bacterium]|jgi:ABC-type multidrug transport system permease subunit|nr:ABC transporter permease [Isosphaeraceae bacterium]
MTRYAPLRELYFARLREFYRQPARIFWVYGFPTVVAVVLGLAFRNQQTRVVLVDLVRGPGSEAIEKALATTGKGDLARGRPELKLNLVAPEEGDKRISTGKAALLVIPAATRPPTYRYDPTRPEAVAARDAFDDAFQRGLGRKDAVEPSFEPVSDRGKRYIDRLIPAFIGMNTMGGGLWGVGFLLVNFRMGKLLKRFMATPMPRRDFLLAILGARLTFLLPDVGVLLALGVVGFGMPIKGSLAVFAIVEVVGALAFAGIGLLLACRASTQETISGLMNLVMIPMWLLSGVFFSYETFPKGMWPFLRALPLTQLVDALRAVLLQGAGLDDFVVVQALLILSAWAVGTFALALRLFRWN